jgi:hypothetical protein
MQELDKKKTGIIVEVKGAGSYSQDGRSLVDYDEISGLLDGISYVSKVQKSDTKLRNFEATYSTKGDLNVTVFNDSSGKNSAAIKIGRIGSQQAFISMDNLAQFARLIVQAKDVLDRPGSNWGWVLVSGVVGILVALYLGPACR